MSLGLKPFAPALSTGLDNLFPKKRDWFLEDGEGNPFLSYNTRDLPPSLRTKLAEQNPTMFQRGIRESLDPPTLPPAPMTRLY